MEAPGVELHLMPLQIVDFRGQETVAMGDQDHGGVAMAIAARLAGVFTAWPADDQAQVEGRLLPSRVTRVSAEADKLERQLMSRREGGSALTQPWPLTLFCGQRLVENVLRDPARFPIK